MLDDDRDALGHVLDAAARIERYCSGMEFEAFASDDRTQDAVIRNIEVIGEAISRLSGELRSRHPTIVWAQAVATRNRLIHGYFAISTQIVWETATRDIPNLASQVRAIIGKEEAREPKPLADDPRPDGTSEDQS